MTRITGVMAMFRQLTTRIASLRVHGFYKGNAAMRSSSEHDCISAKS
jgi:hypothetical protein